MSAKPPILDIRSVCWNECEEGGLDGSNGSHDECESSCRFVKPLIYGAVQSCAD